MALYTVTLGAVNMCTNVWASETLLTQTEFRTFVTMLKNEDTWYLKDSEYTIRSFDLEQTDVSLFERKHERWLHSAIHKDFCCGAVH